MLRLICPKCGKDSYSSDPESFAPCPYCGHLFSGKYGLEKREEKRVEREMNLVFSYQGKRFQGSTSDLSEKGVGIKISGETPVEIGDVIDLTIGDLQIKAKVMWAKKLPDKSLAGLKRMN